MLLLLACTLPSTPPMIKSMDYIAQKWIVDFMRHNANASSTFIRQLHIRPQFDVQIRMSTTPTSLDEMSPHRTKLPRSFPAHGVPDQGAARISVHDRFHCVGTATCPQIRNAWT